MLELGLARTPEELRQVLWDCEFAWLLQLFHARGSRNGVKFSWAYGAGDVSDLEDKFQGVIKQWRSEQR